MKKLLITGFEPFGGEVINPSWQAVEQLPDVIGEYELTKLLLPVVFDTAARMALDKAMEISADAVLAIGQAGGRAAVTPELVAINLRHASIPDNNGNLPKDEPIIAHGETAYFSTVPTRSIAESIAACGIASQVSYSAGTYVCNDVLYTLLAHYRSTPTKVGFIHIPYSKEQGKEPSMDIADVVKALTIAVESLG